MLIIPAIDLLDGKVVRLLRGDYEKVTVYSDDPAVTAAAFAQAGAALIHVVDLDGAREGSPSNLDGIIRIVNGARVDIEVGGGIRSEGDVKALFDIGVQRIVLGTLACEDEGFLKSLVDRYQDRIVVTIDVKGGQVAKRGWLGTSDITPLQLIGRLERLGIRQLIYTDILRDGTLGGGPNLDFLKELLGSTKTSLIASGGISSLEDMVRLKTLEPEGLNGVIIGRALYEGTINLQHAIEMFSS